VGGVVLYSCWLSGFLGFGSFDDNSAAMPVPSKRNLAFRHPMGRLARAGRTDWQSVPPDQARSRERGPRHDAEECRAVYLPRNVLEFSKEDMAEAQSDGDPLPTNVETVYGNPFPEQVGGTVVLGTSK